MEISSIDSQKCVIKERKAGRCPTFEMDDLWNGGHTHRAIGEIFLSFSLYNACSCGLLKHSELPVSVSKCVRRKKKMFTNPNAVVRGHVLKRVSSPRLPRAEGIVCNIPGFHDSFSHQWYYGSSIAVRLSSVPQLAHFKCWAASRFPSLIVIFLSTITAILRGCTPLFHFLSHDSLYRTLHKVTF